MTGPDTPVRRRTGARLTAVALAAGAGAGAVIAARAAGAGLRTVQRHEDPHRWRSVTVGVPQGEIAADSLAPIVGLGEVVELRYQPAPADRGTEIHVRLRPGAEPSAVTLDKGDLDAAGAIRSALRRTKQLVEIGWVPSADEDTGSRPTLLNLPLRAAIARSSRDGVL